MLQHAKVCGGLQKCAGWIWRRVRECNQRTVRRWSALHGILTERFEVWKCHEVERTSVRVLCIHVTLLNETDILELKQKFSKG